MREKLIEINNELIKITKNKKYILIGKLLEDKKCFFKLDINTAYNILRDLKIKEEDIKKAYMNLLDANNY